MRKLVLLFVLGVFVFSCGSSKKTSSRKSKSKTKTERVVIDPRTKPSVTKEEAVEVIVEEKTPERIPNSIDDYIAIFAPIAQEEMRLYAIPASITLAQGILESASGKGRLAVEANNHFGIKCHEWTGAKIYHDDDAAQECFRKYNDAKYSYRDHSLFLTHRSRYKGLFALDIDDYKGWAKGLRAAGYATDRKYPDKLISLIERYDLDKYDDEVTGGKVTQTVSVEAKDTHLIIKGDTLYSLSRKYNTTVDDLKRINNLTNNDLTIGEILIVKSN
ncbi:glucosaminidase domain-containing protein [Xanthomarina sp. F2636L]|uniref:glucosaminidase domain-containing protein n=1 Tax=Xanthomarina sp. F2636L TaxID=2996018 RepID=UPI00225DD621|nr:glucosaminidase domain-containing protein [Xanthomarina sp. F2636L]MCX7552028.1 glucosaminidase domain-containing protein [Xanthomarina sp. F2636L]